MTRSKIESRLTAVESANAPAETVTIHVGIQWIAPDGSVELEPEKTYTWKATERFTKSENARARHRVFR